MSRRVAVISLHTSPLEQPGVGDGGGMNVYVREMTGALAHAGLSCDIYVRTWRSGLPDEVHVEPGVRVVYVDAGPPELPKEALADVVEEFTDGVLTDIARTGRPDTVHAHYWLSGMAGHKLKHALDVPLVTTFHTLARVKGEREPQQRERAEQEVMDCSDAVVASCEPEARQIQQLYGAPADRVHLVPPGVEHALFSPGDREGARWALGLGEEPVLLFVGRIQPLKRPQVAVETLAKMRHGDARLLLVGGPSGGEGAAELSRLQQLVARRGLQDRVRFVDPQPHHLLSTYYRAADVVIVPSRSESFGLVALEAAACGTPVVATDVGGLSSVVEHGRTGLLVKGARPEAFAAAADGLLEHPLQSARMALNAVERARGYGWGATAHGLQDVYRRVRVGSLVDCA